MAFQGNFRCEYCHRSNFLSSRGLTQHLERSRICGLAFERATTHNFSSNSSDEGNESLEPDSSDQSMEMNNIPPEIELPFHDLDAITAQLGAFFDDDFDDETAQFHSSDSDEDEATASLESEAS